MRFNTKQEQLDHSAVALPASCAEFEASFPSAAVSCPAARLTGALPLVKMPFRYHLGAADTICSNVGWAAGVSSC